MDKKAAKQIIAKLEQFMGKEYPGYSTRFSGRYGGSILNITVKIAEVVDGKVLDEDYQALLSIADAMNWDKEELEKAKYHRSLGDVKLVGYKPRSQKYPWIIQDEDGKKYKLDDFQMERLFGFEVLYV